jgi:hypothetical protein
MGRLMGGKDYPEQLREILLHEQASNAVGEQSLTEAMKAAAAKFDAELEADIQADVQHALEAPKP